MVSSKDYCSASRRYGSMIREAERARMLQTLPSAKKRWHRMLFRGWCIARRLAKALVRLTADGRQDALDAPINNRPWSGDRD